MLTDQDALEALAEHAGEAEAARSVYWEDELREHPVASDDRAVGTGALGNVSRKVSGIRTLGHMALQWPLRRFASAYPDLADCEHLGRLIAERQGRQFTYDMLRQCFTLALLRHHLDLRPADECNLVIGDGYGVMSALLLLHAPQRKTIVANLTKPLMLDLVYIRQAVPSVRFALVSEPDELPRALDDPYIQLIAVRADDVLSIARAPIGLAVNIVSMQEMDPPVIDSYFDILRHNKAKQTAFYCCNKLYKRLSDGTELKFNDYPWRNGDTVVHDSVCPWSQWYYDMKPPFWHHRTGKDRIIWHRLTLLEMEAP